MPNHTNLWSHKAATIIQKKLWTIYTQKRQSQKVMHLAHFSCNMSSEHWTGDIQGDKKSTRFGYCCDCHASRSFHSNQEGKHGENIASLLMKSFPIPLWMPVRSHCRYHCKVVFNVWPFRKHLPYNWCFVHNHLVMSFEANWREEHLSFEFHWFSHYVCEKIKAKNLSFAAELFSYTVKMQRWSKELFGHSLHFDCDPQGFCCVQFRVVGIGPCTSCFFFLKHIFSWPNLNSTQQSDNNIPLEPYDLYQHTKNQHQISTPFVHEKKNHDYTSNNAHRSTGQKLVSAHEWNSSDCLVAIKKIRWKDNRPNWQNDSPLNKRPSCSIQNR